MKSLLSMGLLLFSVSAWAQLPFKGHNFGGTYQCTGQDASEGAYTATVTLALIRAQSSGAFGAYSFKLEVPGYGTYLGQAAAKERVMGIHFALTDPAPRDYGTGIAHFAKNKAGKWAFEKFYYEPEFKGGNHGLERCQQQ